MKKSNRTTYLGLAVALATWYNPKKVIFDRALEETNNNLKSAVMRLKKQIVELERDKSRLEKKVEELTRELEKQKK